MTALCVVACSALRVHGFAAASGLAAAIWAIAPLPLLITNALFIKLHPLTVVAAPGPRPLAPDPCYHAR